MQRQPRQRPRGFQAGRPRGRPNTQIAPPFGRISRHRDPVTLHQEARVASALDGGRDLSCSGTASDPGDRSFQIGVPFGRPLPSGFRRYGGHRDQAESPRKGLALRPRTKFPSGLLLASRRAQVQIGLRRGLGLPKGAERRLSSKEPSGSFAGDAKHPCRRRIPFGRPSANHALVKLDLERASAHDEVVHPTGATPRDGGETRHDALRRIL